VSVTVIADEHPTARIAHTCQMCGRTIQPGEVYRRQRNIWDGTDPYVWKECAHCEALLKVGTFDDYWWDEGVNEDTIREWEPPTITDMRWKVQWLRRWARRDGSLYPIPARLTPPAQSGPDGGEQR
jgi:hypothetical protein